MTTYDSAVIEIPGLEFASTTSAGTVAKFVGTAWTDGAALFLDATDGKWKPGGVGPVVANGAALAGAATGAIKILPYLLIGAVGSDNPWLGNAINYLYTANQSLEKRMTASGRTFPIPVVKRAGESWAIGNSIYRVNDPASVDYGMYTKTNAALRVLAGTTPAIAATADVIGFVSVTRLWWDDMTTSDQTFQGSPVSLAKPSGENWGDGAVVYTNGTTYSTTAAAGWKIAGRVTGTVGVGTLTGRVFTTTRNVDPLTLLYHFLQRECYLLVPTSGTDVWIWKQEYADIGGGNYLEDTYRVNVRKYSLILPSTGGEPSQAAPTVSRWFPGLAVALTGTPFVASGWNFPADMVMLWQLFSFVAGGVRGYPYPNDRRTCPATDSLRRMIPEIGTANNGGGLVMGAQGVQLEEGPIQSHYQRWGYPRSVKVWSEQPDTLAVVTGGVTVTAVRCLVEERYSNPALAGADKRAWRTVATVSLAVIASRASGGAGALVKTWYADLAGSLGAIIPSRSIDDVRFSLVRDGGDRFGSPVVDHPFTGSSASAMADTPWIENTGTVPSIYDVPPWRDLIQPGGTSLTTDRVQGGYLPRPTLDPLVWSGGYSIAAVAGSHLSTLTITATRHSSLPVDDDRYSKSTAWWVTIVDPVSGMYLQAATGGKWGPCIRRIRLTTSSTSLDSWSDIVSFTSQGIQVGNIAAAAADLRVVIDAVTTMGSLSRVGVMVRLGTDANQAIDVDRYTTTISIPSTL